MRTIFAAAAVAVLFLASSCAGAPAPRLYPARAAGATPCAYPDPVARGRFPTASFLYASPDNPRRPEYAAPTVTTAPADISPFYDAVESDYWGYGAESVPINGKVWYPASGDGKFPLIVCVHGNHDPRDPSEFGYDYLGEPLASRGFVFASIDENFLNGSSEGENDARGIVLLEHAKTILAWNTQVGNPLYGKLDTGKLLLIGHSRGGEGAVHAATFNRLRRYPDDAKTELNYGLPLSGVVSIAPAEGQYRPAGRICFPDGVDYLVLQGSLDGDVFPYMGLTFYNAARPAPGDFKVSFWIQGANHAQFNSSWATSQDPGPSFRSALMPASDQARVALASISAFAEVSLRGDAVYADFFRDLPAAYLPAADYRVQSAFGDDIDLASFDEDADPATAGFPGWAVSASGFDTWKEAEQRIFPGTGFRPTVITAAGIKNDLDSWNIELEWKKPKDTPKEASPAAPAAPEAVIPPERIFTLAGPAVRVDELLFDIAVRQPATELESGDAGIDVRLVLEDGSAWTRPLSDFLAATPLAPQWLPMIGSEARTIFETAAVPVKADGGTGALVKVELLFRGASGAVSLDNFRLRKENGQ